MYNQIENDDGRSTIQKCQAINTYKDDKGIQTAILVQQNARD